MAVSAAAGTMVHDANSRKPWALILAGGSGLRLSRLTTGDDGTPVPKQFCLFAGRTLLAATLARARTLAPRERTVAVVNAEHRRFWGPDLVPVLADVNIAVQPCNRGTAAGILFPLLGILRRDPAATVVILPSDHFVANEALLAAELRRAVALARAEGGRVVLLGMAVERFTDGLGWITPESDARPAGIRAFVEKPSAEDGEAARAAGALANSFLIAAQARALLELCERAAPELVAALRAAERGGAAAMADYATLPALDFSRHVAEPSAGDPRLRVLRVPPCGWSDLGTPERLAAAIRTQAAVRQSPAASGPRRRPDLGRLVGATAARAVPW